MGLLSPKTWSLHKSKGFLKGFFSKCDQIRGNCEFGHIYWRNPSWKTSFLCSGFCEHTCSSLWCPVFEFFLNFAIIHKQFNDLFIAWFLTIKMQK